MNYGRARNAPGVVRWCFGPHKQQLAARDTPDSVWLALLCVGVAVSLFATQECRETFFGHKQHEDSGPQF